MYSGTNRLIRFSWPVKLYGIRVTFRQQRGMRRSRVKIKTNEEDFAPKRKNNTMEFVVHTGNTKGTRDWKRLESTVGQWQRRRDRRAEERRNE